MTKARHRDGLFGGALMVAGMSAAVATSAFGQCVPQLGTAIEVQNYAVPGLPVGPTVDGIAAGNGLLHAAISSYAYVGDGYVYSRVLHTFDVSDPANATLIASWDSNDRLGFDIAVQGTTLVTRQLGASSAIETFNISDPSNGVPLGSLDLGGGPVRKIYDLGSAIAVVSRFPSVVHTVSLADPFNPVLLDSLPIAAIRSVLDPIGDPALGILPLLVGNGGQESMLLVDLRDPASISELSTTPSVPGQSIEIAGNTAIVSLQRSFRLFDVTDPTSPQEIATIDPPFDPANPVQPSGDNFDLSRLTTSGTVLYATDTDNDTDDSSGATFVFDFADPLAPTPRPVIPRAPFSGGGNGELTVRDTFAAPGLLIREGVQSIAIADISTCAVPPEVIVFTPAAIADEGGDPVELNVVASDALVYRWSKDGVELTDDATFSGTQTPTLTAAAVAEAEGVYTCEVTNADGSDTSGPAVVAIRTSGGSLPGCSPADLIAPFGVLDLTDIDTFIASFLAGCP
ncbi:MAG: hypothetical protein AAGI53_17515 [Planctomycetota bacterium]